MMAFITNMNFFLVMNFPTRLARVCFGTDDNMLCSASSTLVLNILLLVGLGRCGEVEWCNMEYIFLVSVIFTLGATGVAWSEELPVDVSLLVIRVWVELRR